jgi:tRNA-Thr(GGU) m(6)t(6)A37 methyltransferase TsaA
MASDAIVFRPIGHVENEIGERAMPDVISAVESRIVLDPQYVDGLKGLAAQERVMVVFHFDRSEGYELQQHPRGDKSRPPRGVFALCSPNRPNGIGVTVVDLLEINGNVLRVTGLDAINGTPVLDLKPAD